MAPLVAAAVAVAALEEDIKDGHYSTPEFKRFSTTDTTGTPEVGMPSVALSAIEMGFGTALAFLLIQKTVW